MIWNAWRRPFRWEKRLDKELQFHLEQQIRDYVAAGLGPEEARQRAHREFGGIELTKEECRDQRPLRWLADMVQDTRFATRIFLRYPLFAVTAALTLALGIGANTAMFTVVHHVLLKNLAVDHPEQLVELNCKNMPGNDVGCAASYPGFLIYRENNQVFSGLFAFNWIGELNTIYNGSAEFANGLLASADMYSVLGVSPAIGRLLNSTDDTPGAASVTVLSYSFWQRRFGGDPRVIGHTLQLNNQLVVIVGVTPPDFRGVELGRVPDVTLPMGSAADVFNGKGSLANRGLWWLRIIGRRKTGLTIDQVQASLEPVFRRTIDDLLSTMPVAVAPRIRPLVDAMHFRAQPAALGAASEFRRDLDRPLRILMSVVSLVLLIACANLASLLLSRASVRRREFGVRLAIGAERARLVRQLLTETLLLSTVGGAIGLAFAWWGGSILVGMSSGETGLRAVDTRPDLSMLLFTGVVSLATGLLLGMAPALRASKADPQAALREMDGKQTFSRLGQILVAGQVALTVLLLVGAGLFLRTFQNFRHIDNGFRTDNLLSFVVSPGLLDYKELQTRAYVSEVLTRIENLPGIRSVSVSNSAMGRLGSIAMIEAPNFESSLPMEHTAGRNAVGARFAETLGLKLLQGRDFSRADNESSPKVAVVNESFAKHFFGTTDAIGKHFGEPDQKGFPYEVVGVVGDARDRGPKAPAERAFYPVFAQEHHGSAVITVRSDRTERERIVSLLGVVKTINPAMPIHEVRTMEYQIDEALTRERLLATLGVLFGGMALLLVAIGLYGLLAGSLVSRTNELGIRVALGASRANIVWLVVREGLLLVLLGLMAGLGGGMLLTRFVRSQLFGIAANDPLTLITAVFVLLGVALLAIYLPARRALNVDPGIALRYE